MQDEKAVTGNERIEGFNLETATTDELWRQFADVVIELTQELEKQLYFVPPDIHRSNLDNACQESERIYSKS